MQLQGESDVYTTVILGETTVVNLIGNPNRPVVELTPDATIEMIQRRCWEVQVDATNACITKTLRDSPLEAIDFGKNIAIREEAAHEIDQCEPAPTEGFTG